jgi:membrane associated rhomboid family serine protease
VPTYFFLNNKNMRIPPVVKTLLLVNVAVYFLFIILDMSGLNLSGLFALYYVGSPYFQVFQLFTYMFMHGGLMHLFFNMFALWMFGRIMEQVWGGRRFLLYYLVCGIGAGIVQETGQLLGLISPMASTVGASGAIYGVLLAFGMTFPNERLFVIPIPFPIKAKYFVAGYALLELFQGSGSNDGVAHYAHLGGMLFGLLLILYWRHGPRRASSSSRRSWRVGDYGVRYREASGYDKGGEETFFARIRRFFGVDRQERQERQGGAKMHAEPGGRAADYDYNARKRADSEEIDRILDKIRQGGYASLSEEEKRKLFDASRQ